jgi:putative tryptophan/tyrosine transport system substrate-binding protein
MMPMVGLISGASADTSADLTAAFRKGLGENGYVERQNVMVEYHWLNGQYDDLSELMADLVRRRVVVIATSAGWPGVKAARAATATIPIVFSIGDDPVRLGLVASFKYPGGSATGVNFFTYEAVGKQFDLLHQSVPALPQ